MFVTTIVNGLRRRTHVTCFIQDRLRRPVLPAHGVPLQGLPDEQHALSRDHCVSPMAIYYLQTAIQLVRTLKLQVEQEENEDKRLQRVVRHTVIVGPSPAVLLGPRPADQTVAPVNKRPRHADRGHRARHAQQVSPPRLAVPRRTHVVPDTLPAPRSLDGLPSPTGDAVHIDVKRAHTEDSLSSALSSGDVTSDKARASLSLSMSGV